MNRKLIRPLTIVVALAPSAGLVASGHMGWGYVLTALWAFLALLGLGLMFRDEGARMLMGEEDNKSDFLVTIWSALALLVVVVLSAIEAPDRGWIPVIGFIAGTLWAGLYFVSRGLLRFPGFHGAQPGGLVLASEAPPLHPRELAIGITLNTEHKMCAHELLVGTVVKAFESASPTHHCWCCGRSLPTLEGHWVEPPPPPDDAPALPEGLAWGPTKWFCADCPDEAPLGG